MTDDKHLSKHALLMLQHRKKKETEEAALRQRQAVAARESSKIKDVTKKRLSVDGSDLVELIRRNPYDDVLHQNPDVVTNKACSLVRWDNPSREGDFDLGYVRTLLGHKLVSLETDISGNAYLFFEAASDDPNSHMRRLDLYFSEGFPLQTMTVRSVPEVSETLALVVNRETSLDDPIQNVIGKVMQAAYLDWWGDHSCLVLGTLWQDNFVMEFLLDTSSLTLNIFVHQDREVIVESLLNSGSCASVVH